MYSAEPVPREALTDECDILVVGAGFAGLLLWHKLQPGRVRRRPLLREGRRRRRHVVLEPLSGHRLRRRVLQLPAAARGDGLRPDDEVRVGVRDLRVLPEDGRAVRLLRALPVPHDGRADGVGRGDRPLDGVHRPRRRHAGPLRDPRQRHPDEPEAGPHRRAWRRFQGESFHTSRWNYDVDLEGKRVGIIGTGATAVQAIPELAKVVGELYVFQRTPSTIDVRDQRATTRRGAGDMGERAGLGPGPAGPLRQDLGRAHGDPGQRRLPRRQGRRLQGAQAARARADAGGADREAARLELPDHGADPGAGRRHRRGPEDGRGAEAVLPLRLQAADVPRRVPADVQPAPRPPRRHRADRRAARSTSGASCTTAWSTRSTC